MTNIDEAIKKTSEEARGTVDDYFLFLERSISSFPSGDTELGEKLKSCAEENVAAMRAYVHNLGQAKDVQEVVRVQVGFMQSQFNRFGEQTKTLTEACAKAAADAVNKPFKNVA